MKKSYLLVALSVLAVGGLMTSCGEAGIADGTRVAYAVDSGSTPATNLIRAEVTAKDGKVTNVVYDEVKFAGATVGKISEDTASEIGVDNYVFARVTSYGTTSTNFYAKHLSVDGKVWTASVTDNVLSYTNGTDNYDTYYGTMTDQDGLAAFYHALVNNYVFAVDTAGTELAGAISEIYSKASNLSTYWAATYGSTTYTWKQNIDKIAKALIGKDISKLTVSKADEKSAGYIDSVSTGATINCFSDYIAVAQKAFTDSATKIGVSYILDSGSTPATNVIRAEVSKADGVIKNVYFDEVKFPATTLANITEDVASEIGIDNYVFAKVTAYGSTSTKFYGKYVSYAGKVYTASVTDNVVSYKNGNDSLDVVNGTLTEQADIQALFMNVTNNFFFTCAADGTANGLNSEIVSKASKLSTYWAGTYGTTTLTWKGNMEKIVKALIGKDPSKLTATKASETAEGYLDSVTTGATINCFTDYIDVVKAAF